MEQIIGDLSEQTARTLLNVLAPNSELLSIAVPEGSFSNYTHIVTARAVHKRLISI